MKLITTLQIKLFWETMEVINISLQGQYRLLNYISIDCYSSQGNVTSQNDPYDDSYAYSYESINNTAFSISDTENVFTAVGCDTQAQVYLYGSKSQIFKSGCFMYSLNTNDLINGSCTGIACCQTSIPKGIKTFDLFLSSYDNHTYVYDFNPCSYAFLADTNWYNFSTSHLLNFNYNINEAGYPRAPLVIDWAIDWPTKKDISCEAVKNQTSYACGNHSVCGVSKNGFGYSCNCSQGYQGNPYLQDGCQDINECVDPNDNLCTIPFSCINLPGTYNCSCPHGFQGDGFENSTRCTSIPKKFPVIPVFTGIVFGVLLPIIMLWAFHKRKVGKLKERLFKQNGGLLFKQQLSMHPGSTETVKIFTEEELKKATNNYAESQILGRGGYGIVYKGILPDHRTIAIKKSLLLAESQIEQFINEIVILSQINHRNVVKILGCCLESKVPLLVYEFITNNTLFHHIHDEACKSYISWDNRLRIATETAEAIAYLHSAALPPIIHRDIKSTNILLDDNYTAKVSDFGASRLVPVDKTQLSTLVHGTMGYLDPEYVHSSQLTVKSDVYSFGVVLVELLTGKVAFSFIRPKKERNLAMHFLTSMKMNIVWEIVENRVLQEGSKEQIQEVMELAKKCLCLKGEKRPTMKDVATMLEGLRRSDKHPSVLQNPKEVECLLLREP
ncbi:hypothetical protein NE237_008706 [Protea cynaroides]|uniref:Uncharacterized protein n=1 Tax=Protea cynaroides TaxID=273540 RepID=A0A9Q0KX09_9MAGN|nr:hypothetical protein NE237_008706 [Protea cynaroides]